MGLAETFKVLSDPARREIMQLLKGGRMNAGELASELNMTPAALSYHLNMLKRADLVLEYRQKNYIYYELDCTILDEMIMWLKQFEELEGQQKRQKASLRRENIPPE